MGAIGQRLRRLEDPRLLRGAGRFVDDVDLPGQLWMRVARARVAHARIVAINAEAARALPGVQAVITGQDLCRPRGPFGAATAEEARGGPFAAIPVIPIRLRLTAEPLDAYLQPVLATERVRYVGEPIAVILAEDPYRAEDAASLLEVEYEELPALLDAREATRPDAPALFAESSNEAACLRMGYGDAGRAFQTAAYVVRSEFSIGRHSGVPLETRGLVAAYDPDSDCLTIWGATKVPHFNQRVLARLLGMPAQRIRMMRTDAGGGFGVRGEFYPEDFLVPYLARVLARPIKWIEDRYEHLMATNHSREQMHQIEAAFDARYRLLALRDTVWHDNGAYLRTHGVTVPELTLSMLPGPYRVPAYEATIHVALTNKTPCGTYRGPGRYEGTAVREHLLDVAAHELGIDRLALRRINLLRADEMPHRRALSALGTDVVLDAGDYPGLLDKTLRASGFSAWDDEARRLRAEGRLVGTGIAYFLEKSGLGPYETASVEVDAAGAVRVYSGGASLGQGIETVLAQIAAEELSIDPAAIEVIYGDTDLVADGVGSWASRSTVVGGSAVYQAAREVAALARARAAEMLEVAAEDLWLEQGRFVVAGAPSRSVSLAEVAAACERDAAAAEGTASGRGRLSAQATFSADHMTYPYGVHLAQVEVDAGTGRVVVRRYFIGYEVGRAVNPTLVEGQLAGGAAQGLGGALMEEFRYDERGQPLAATFMDYLIPTASEVPRVGLLLCEDAPSPDNPLGVKGAGEGGVTGCGAALLSAVEDALSLPGAITALPITPQRVRRLLMRSTAPAQHT